MSSGFNLECKPLCYEDFEKATEILNKPLHLEPQYMVMPQKLYDLLAEYGDPEEIIREVLKEENMDIWIKCLNDFNKES